MAPLRHDATNVGRSQNFLSARPDDEQIWCLSTRGIVVVTAWDTGFGGPLSGLRAGVERASGVQDGGNTCQEDPRPAAVGDGGQFRAG